MEGKNGEIVLRPLPRYPLIAMKGKYKATGNDSLTAALLHERRAERVLENDRP